MARKKSRSQAKSRRKSRLYPLISLVLAILSGGGFGAYFNPDWPVIGPLVQKLRQEQAAVSSNEGSAPGRLWEAWRNLGAESEMGQRSIAPPSRNDVIPADSASSQRSNDKLSIATFNIQVFGESKLQKPQVMDVLVQVVRQFDIVAIQEVRAKSDNILPRFLAAINADGSRYDFLIGPRLGRTASTEQYAIIYDTMKVEYEPTSVGTISDPADLLHREPFVARFRTRVATPEQGFSFWLVVTHTDPDEVKEEVAALADVFQIMQSADSREDDVILLGDLNASESQLGRLGQIPGITWVVRDTMTNTRQTKAYDNILFDQQATSEYLGRWGVFNLERAFGLTRDEALQVSDHYPVWAEFQILEAGSRSKLADRVLDRRR